MTLVPDVISSVVWRGRGGVGEDGSPSLQWAIWGLQGLFRLMWEVRKLPQYPKCFCFFLPPTPHDLWDFSSLTRN